jgi:hypothetical protein
MRDGLITKGYRGNSNISKYTQGQSILWGAKNNGHVEDIDDYDIYLNLDAQKDQRTYNLLVAFEVVAVWVKVTKGI